MRRVAFMRTLSAAEERLVEWADGQGLDTMFDTVYDEDGQAIDQAALCIESRCDDGRLHAYFLTCDPEREYGWPGCAELLRLAWRSYLAEHGLQEVVEVT